jgi:hypothetical protein
VAILVCRTLGGVFSAEAPLSVECHHTFKSRHKIFAVPDRPNRFENPIAHTGESSRSLSTHQGAAIQILELLVPERPELRRALECAHQPR